MKKKWNIVGLLLAVFVAMMVCPVDMAMGQGASVDVTITPHQSVPYVVFNNGTLTLKSASELPEGVEEFKGNEWSNGSRPHRDYYAAQKIIIDPSFADFKPTTCAYWFSNQNFENLEIIEGLNNINTSDVTDMSHMFEDNNRLTTIDLSGLNMSNVTDMSNMFSGCCNLRTIYVDSKWNTSAVSNSESMFSKCYKLVGEKGTRYYGDADIAYAKIDGEKNTPGYFTQSGHTPYNLILPYAKFNDGTLTLGYDSNGIPDGAYEINELFDYSVTDYKDETHTSAGRRVKSYIAYSIVKAQNVTKIVFDKSFSNFRPVILKQWFCGCSNLTAIEGLEYLNTENVTDMNMMFKGCSSLLSLDLSGFNTASVTDMGNMFDGCSNLRTIWVGENWTTSAVAMGESMFYGCSALVGGQGTEFDANAISNIYACIDGGASNPGYFTNKPNEAYATFDTQNGTLTFYYNCNKPDGAFGMKTDEEDEWYSLRREITKVVFDQSFANYRPTSCAYWFYRCYNLSEIKGIENLNTENVESMEWMFACCTNLSTLDLSSFNTGSVENMSDMFYCCSGLSNLNLNGFNTSNVKDMSGMFCRCGSLTSLDLSSFDTRNVTDMSYMFYGNNKLAQINLSSFNTAKVIDMQGMFGGDVGDYDSYPEDPDEFYGNYDECGCYALKSLDLSNFDTKNVTDMRWMFEYGGFTNLDLSSFNTGNVTTMYGMFKGCKKLETIYVSDKWSTSEVTESENMFWGCENLFGEKGTECVPDKVGHEFAKIDGGESAPGYFTQKGNKFNGKCPYATLKNNTLTFYYDNKCPNDAYKIAKFRDDWYMPNWLEADFSKVVFDKSFAEYKPNKLDHWFFGCENIKEIVDLQNLNTQDVTNMDAMFENCSSLTSLDLSNFNTKNVTSIWGMFYGCSSLTTLDLSNFNTQNVTTMMEMFSGCSSLTTLDLSSFDTEKAELRDMFTGCSNLTTIFAGDKWSTKSVYVGIDEVVLERWDEEVYITGDMFAGCTSLVGGKGTKFDENNITYTYAHIDGGQGNPGYLTAVEIVSISVTTLPKTTYLEGEDLNLDGGVVSVNYNNGSIETADLAKAEISGFDKTKSGEQTLTVKYMGKETSFIVTVKSPMPYATFANGTLTLGYGSDIPNDATKISGEVVQSLSKSTSSNYIASDITAAKNVQKVVFDNTFADYQPENCAYWFNGCNNLTGIDGMENLDTKNTTDMTAMFQNCEKLASLDLSGFNTTKVTDMSKMFSNCTELTTIFVGDTWNMSNVEKTQDMFKNCQKLVGGNGTQYDANNSDEDFAKIDGKNSGYFTKAGQEPYKVSEPYAVFNNGTLTFYYDNKKPNGAYGMKVTYDSEWYSVASDMKIVVFDNSFAEYRPTSCSWWFDGCENLTEIIDIKNLNTEKVTTMKSMFYKCNNLQTLDLSSFNTKNVTDMCFMLDSCVNLKTVDLSSFNTKNVTDMYNMFAYCYNLTSIDLSNFDTKNVTDMGGLFYKCTNLKTIDVSSFDTKNVTDMDFMFSDCGKLQNIDLSNFDTRNVTNMKAMFQSCSSLQNLDLSSFNTKNVTDMSYMFTSCNTLQPIYVSDNWSTSAVTESEYMFYDNSSLVGGKGTAFNSGKTDKSYARIDGGKDNPGYFTKSGEKPYEEPTPVSEITPANYNTDIWSFDKTIYVQNPGKEIRIVDMSGRLVKTVKATADRMEIQMQKSGIYIVKTGAKTQKVMIK